MQTKQYITRDELLEAVCLYFDPVDLIYELGLSMESLADRLEEDIWSRRDDLLDIMGYPENERE